MIHVVNQQNRVRYKEALQEMHRLRRVHFVEERGWTAMTVRDGAEYDAYDDDLALYLLAIEPDGAVSASMRMRPARSGSILADVFPHLLADGADSTRDPKVWEISRYFASGRGRGRGGVTRRAQVRLAALEVAQHFGVERLIGMIDIEVLPAMLDGSGWRVRPIGLPAAYNEGVAQAIQVEVSNEALTYMAETQGLTPHVAFALEVDRHPTLLPQDVEALLSVEHGSPTLSQPAFGEPGKASSAVA